MPHNGLAVNLSAGMKALASLSPDKLLLRYEKFTFRQAYPAAIYRVLCAVANPIVRLRSGAGFTLNAKDANPSMDNARTIGKSLSIR